MAKHWRFLVFAITLGALSACGPGHVDLDNVRPTPQLLSGHLSTTDGLTLPFRSWIPDAPPKAVIIALHGFNDYSNFFDAPGRFFATKGFASYAYDQRGFGAGPFRGQWFDTDWYIDDAAVFSQTIAARYPDTPLYVLGASMGGAVAINLAATRTPDWIDGIILSAPAIWGRQTMPWYQSTLLDVTAAVWPTLRLTGRGLKITPSDNREMLIALGHDPLVIKGSQVGTLSGLVDLMGRAFENAAKLQTPALFLYGGKDEIIRKEPTQQMLATLPSATSLKRETIIYPEGYHMLLRDKNGPAVWQDIVDWINRAEKSIVTAQ